MKFIFAAIAMSMCLIVPLSAEEAGKLNVPQYIQDISVTIQSGHSQGSGTYKMTKDGTVWILTCGHVVADLRKTRELFDGKGGKKMVVEFDDAKVRQFLKEDGRLVGELSYAAEVIRYSDADNGEDIAILRLRTKKLKPLASANFYREKAIPEVGQELLHCGSLMGEFGSNSVTPGIISQHGRLLEGKTYDQTTCVVYPGSSGGAVVLKGNGQYVGMIVRGAIGGFNLMVPVRRIQSWTEKVGVDFIFDDAKTVPSEEKLRSTPIDTGASDAHLPAAPTPAMPKSGVRFLVAPLQETVEPMMFLPEPSALRRRD